MTPHAGSILRLLALGPDEPLPADQTFWRDFSHEWMRLACRRPSLAPEPPRPWLKELWENRPLEPGWEDESALEVLWLDFNRLHSEQTNPEAWLRSLGGDWKIRGRVTLHVAENPAGGAKPFLFVATYVEDGRHLPLGRALKDAAADGGADGLRSLLEPLRDGASASTVLRDLLESRAVYQPQAWSPTQTKAFLEQTPAMRDAGLDVKTPDWWQSKRCRPQASLEIGAGEPTAFGAASLLGFKAGVALGDTRLSREDIQELLKADAPLVSFKGRWVEVDRHRLESLLSWWNQWEAAHEAGVPLHIALRLLGGFSPALSMKNLPPEGWEASAAPNFQSWLTGARQEIPVPIPGLPAQLRAYQREGVSWIRFGASLGLGLCLADDMGLGKTIQVIASWLLSSEEKPHLLVCPASLLGNWASELAKFAPGLPVHTVHASSTDSAPGARTRGVVLTTYGMLDRLPVFQSTHWASVTLDEAQAIKNPASQRARTVKRLQTSFRLALTGTPIENGPSDLWSLFDFLLPGWLGPLPEFLTAIQQPGQIAALRRTLAPLMLRRKKTDPGIAPELPEKLERTVSCRLTRRQAALYERSVAILRSGLPAAQEPSQRKGLILQTILRLKQICDHPSLFVGDGVFDPRESGKCQQLDRLAALFAGAREKTLVFTQFRAMMEVIDTQLQRVYGRPGLMIHGGVPAPERMARAQAFQRDDGPPYFVISLMAGGTGLNLTAATQVIHFDRWWNPAVERQATDRAFRIGQKRQVTVHTFLCRGTFEEKLDKLLRDKSAMAEDCLDTPDAPPALWRMSDSELLDFFQPT